MAMNLEFLLTAGITLVVVGIALAFGLQVQGEVRDQIGVADCTSRTDGFTSYNSTNMLCTNSTGGTVSVGTSSFNASGDAIDGVSALTGQMPTIGLIVAAVIIIGLLISGFAFALTNNR